MGRITGVLAMVASLWGSVTLAQTAEQQQQPAKQWTVQDFAALPMMNAPGLSPNGRHIASRIAIGGEQKLIIADIFDKGDKNVRTIPLGDNDLNWWKWVNDDWLVIGFGAESNVEGSPWYLTRVVGVKADGTKINLIAKNVAAQNAGDVIWMARDGSPRILLSYQSSIYYSDRGFWPPLVCCTCTEAGECTRRQGMGCTQRTATATVIPVATAAAS